MNPVGSGEGTVGEADAVSRASIVPSALPIAHTCSQRDVPGPPVSMHLTAPLHAVETPTELSPRNAFTLFEASISVRESALTVMAVSDVTVICKPR